MDSTSLNSAPRQIRGLEIEMSKHTEGQFVICGGSDQFWIGTNAKTLNGAKALASKTYQAAVDGKIEVAVCRAGLSNYEVVSVKYGHGAWQNSHGY